MRPDLMRRALRIGLPTLLLGGGLALGGLALNPVPGQADEAPHLVPAPALDLPPAHGLRTLVVSGGCFWGVQGVFQHVRGVRDAVSGYAGGARDTAQYETVSTGTTGHAESVRITYDPAVVSYGTLLRIFFSVALDPTQRGGQGPDEGSQYRSEIWTTTPAEARVARAYIAQLDASHAFEAAIATRVDSLPAFYPAESYHQNYLTLNPNQPYIAINDIPKVEALQRIFPQDWQAKPVLVPETAQQNTPPA